MDTIFFEDGVEDDVIDPISSQDMAKDEELFSIAEALHSTITKHGRFNAAFYSEFKPLWIAFHERIEELEKNPT